MSNQTITTPPNKLQGRRRPRPYMRMFWGDYFGDTRHLSTLEHGAYLLLIGAYWNNGGPLPNDPRLLRRITGLSLKQWTKIGPTLAHFFFQVDSHWHHQRIDFELEYASDRSADGVRANSVRWSDRIPIPEPEPEPEPEPDKKEREDKIPPSAELSRYAFEHGVIKLTQKHLDAWIRAYPSVAVEGALYALEPWAAKQSNWFQAVAGALDKREREARVVHNQNEEEELWENRELNRYSWVGDDGKQYTQERGGDLYEYKGDKLTNLGKGHPQEWKWKKRGSNGSL